MADLNDSVDAGHYARLQIHSRDPLIAWSHRRRFRTAVALARPFAGGRLLDYGCGDGTFLSLLQTSGAAPALAVGAEIDPRVIVDCTRRFGAVANVRFVSVADLQRDEHARAYDAIFCMEVLEHVVDPATMLETFKGLLAPGGTLVISVPIETGIPVVVKQIVRRIAGWRGVGHYPGTTGYTFIEMVRSVFARSTQHVPRPVIAREDGSTFHDHKGFNWMVLRDQLERFFVIERRLTSPFPCLGPGLATQVWFVGTRRP